MMVVTGAGGVILACGSEATGLDLLAPDASVDGSSGGSSSGSNTSSSSSGSSGNPLNDGGETTDGGNSADGGVNPPGAGPGGNTTTVACGATTCSIATESCCVSQVPSGSSFACVSGATCPAPAGGGDTIALKCSSQANCAPGTVCCVGIVANGDNAASQCQTSCTGDQAQLCDPNAGAATGCAASAPCSSKNISDWKLPSTFATCGGKGN